MLNHIHVKLNKILISKCEYDYSFSNEEKNSFEPGWINQTTQIYSSSIQQAFKYETSDELDSYMIIGEHGTIWFRWICL